MRTIKLGPGEASLPACSVSNKRYRWEKLNNKQFKAISEYISLLPAHEEWEKLSPLTLKLKSAFLSSLTAREGFAANPGSGKRKRVVVDGPSKQKRRAKTNSSKVCEDSQDIASLRSHSPTYLSRLSNMRDSSQMLAEVATTPGPVSHSIFGFCTCNCVYILANH